jgi:mono/diheme cytochrome c family protein
MWWRVLNVVLVLAFVGTVALHVFAGRDLTRRNVEVMPEMAYSPAYDSLAPNPNFADGKTLQLPEPGTIARGRPPLRYGPSFEDFLRAGDELHNPFAGGPPALAASTVGLLGSPSGQGPLLAASALGPGTTFRGDDAPRQRGAFVFTNYCQVCHGPEGKADGPMVHQLVQRNIPPPLSLVAPKPVPLKDGEMFHIITFGQKNMPSHAAQLSREDRWKVILHVRSLQQKAAGEKRP